MYDFAAHLWPICRSITGDGVRETLALIRHHIPELQVHEVPSGSQAFDWTVPDEWNIRSARLTGPNGETIADFRETNLSVVNYSEPVDIKLSLESLMPHLYSLPERPDAVPYVTSYYKRRWGFCLPHRKLQALEPGEYHAQIDSTLEPGHLTYGEVVVPGELSDEVFLSTYICHPSMANNELSGPVVATWLYKWLVQEPRKYTYRFVFVPETIGSIVYLSRNLSHLKANAFAGFNVTCVGDERCYSYLPSRSGHTLSDKVATLVLDTMVGDYHSYSFLDRGSDERQYCAPGVDLPIASIMRSKYGEYPEYHTSDDDMSFISAEGLASSLDTLRLCLQIIEINDYYRATVLCEPQLGKYGLYPTLGTRQLTESARILKDLLAYADGDTDLVDIMKTIGAKPETVFELLTPLVKNGLITRSAS